MLIIQKLHAHQVVLRPAVHRLPGLTAVFRPDDRTGTAYHPATLRINKTDRPQGMVRPALLRNPRLTTITGRQNQTVIPRRPAVLRIRKTHRHQLIPKISDLELLNLLGLILHTTPKRHNQYYSQNHP